MTAPPITPAQRAALPGLWREGADTVAPPGGLRRLLLTLTALLLVLLVLSATLPIDGAVIASGQVTAQSQVKRVAHPTGGVIGAILVHNGDHVRAGQPLLRLDDRVTGADAQLTGMTVDQLLAQKARAEAERLGQAALTFPPELTGAGSSGAAQAMADERRLFELHQGEERGIRAQLTARIAQYHAEIAGFAAQIAAVREQRRLIEPERQGMRALWDKQLVTIGRLNQLERTAVDLDGSVGSLEAQIAQARARMTEARGLAIQSTQSRRVAAGTELGQINAALGQQQIRSVSASDARDRSTVRAPTSGTVEKIAFAAVGDVIRPAEPILEVVPDHDALVIEAMIRPADIDHVRTGQDARVRLSGLDRATTPELPGKVIYVAADRSENAETRQAFYLVRIMLDPAAAARAEVPLKVGMPAEVHVIAGSRSLLSYLLKPLRDQFARAFRDN